MRYRDYARNAGKKTEELTVVEQAEFEHLQQRFEHEVRTRLTGTPIDRVELLQYGDAPQIEPGELLGRIVFALPIGARAVLARAVLARAGFMPSETKQGGSA